MRDCEHGHLARSCEKCMDEETIRRLRKIVSRLMDRCLHDPGCNVHGTGIYGLSCDCDERIMRKDAEEALEP